MKYKIKSGDSLARIAKKNNITLNQLLSANPQFKADPNTINIGDIVLLTDKKKKRKIPPKKKSIKPSSLNNENDDFLVPYGQLTFDLEGQESRGRYFSRILHVPGAYSGATIGRGYDMGMRSQREIIDDLREASISLKNAKIFSTCRGLKGRRAKHFIKENNLSSLMITPEQQKKMFLLTYRELEGDVLRICNKADVVAKYGVTDWLDLHQGIKDLVVDLRYRGDYTGTTREKIQEVLVKNNLSKLKRVMQDEEYWVRGRGVPKNRFKERNRYLSEL